MSLLILEVDGTLANPYAAGAVALWALVLSGIAGTLVRGLISSTRATYAWALLYAAALVITDPAQRFVGRWLYKATDLGIADVHFWDGPPVWIGPAASICVAVVAWLVLVRRRARRASNRDAAAPGPGTRVDNRSGVEG